MITVLEHISSTQVKIELAGESEVICLGISNGNRRCLACNKIITFGSKSWKASTRVGFWQTKCWCTSCFKGILSQ